MVDRLAGTQMGLPKSRSYSRAPMPVRLRTAADWSFALARCQTGSHVSQTS